MGVANVGCRSKLPFGPFLHFLSNDIRRGISQQSDQ